MMPNLSSNYSTIVVAQDAFYGPHSNGTYTSETIKANFISAPILSLPFHRLLMIVFLFQVRKIQLQTGVE